MMKAIRELLEAIAPSGARPMESAPVQQPVPPGNIPVKKQRNAWLVGIALLVLIGYLSCNRPQPASPVSRSSRVAPQQTTTLTPEEVAQSGHALQNDTNGFIANGQAQHNLSPNQFNADPANAGLVDPNREAKLRALNAQQEPTYQQAAYPSGPNPAADARKEREAAREKALHSSPYVPPTQMAELQRPGAPAFQVTAPLPPAPTELTPVVGKSKDSPEWSKYDGSLHRILAGTVLRGVIKNRIEGSYSGPAVIQIDDDVYTHDRTALVMKAGTVLMGTAKAVNSQWQSRVDLQTSRVIMPDGFSQALKELPGLSQSGEMGISDQVNRHYGQIFGSALVIGALGALGQIGNSQMGYGYDPGVGIRNGVTQQMGQTGQRLLDRFSSRPPTLTIREGTRVSLILSDDILLPEYAKHLVDKNL